MTDPERPALRVWTIYFSPSDYPGKFVVRSFLIIAGGDSAPEAAHTCHDTLDAARAAVPPGRFKMARDPTDQPPIIETWM